MNYNDHAKVRTPYPRINFERAYNYLLKIRQTYPDENSLAKNQIVKALGLSPASGTTHSALGALSHYGFAYKTGAQESLRYQLSELALKLIETYGSKEWGAVALKSITLPEAFNFLYSYDRQGQLSENTEILLTERYDAINKQNVREIIKLYFDSISFINRDVPIDSIQESSSHKKYEFSLGNGVVISASEEVIINALKHYLKNIE